ncbi:DUF177 domain-containing protein [Atopobiaceae bacterium 24-176]
MDIKPILVSIDDHLALPGDTWPVSGHVDVRSYRLGDHDFTVPDGIDYDIVLTNTGDGILATGIVKADVLGTCDRCLEQARIAIASEVDEYFLFELPDASEQADDEDDVDFSLVNRENNTIDLAEPINAAVIMETPFVVLCREDCKGLCPHCGANLNEGDCGCAEVHANDVDPMNPFSVLAQLKRDVAEGQVEQRAAEDAADEAAAEAWARAMDSADEDGR